MSNINRLKVDFIDKETMCRFDDHSKVMVMFDYTKSEIVAYYMNGDMIVELEIKVK